MPNTFFFERHHDILINVPPDVVLITSPTPIPGLNGWPRRITSTAPTAHSGQETNFKKNGIRGPVKPYSTGS